MLTEQDAATWAGLSPREQKRQFYIELRRHCLDKGYKSGWTACMYKERFGVWPPDEAVRLAPAPTVSAIVRDWLNDRNRAYFAQKKASERLA